jgi:hypothetical protein
LVESKFWALQNVSIATSSLSRLRRDLGKDTSRCKLVINLGLQSASGLTPLKLFSNLDALALDIKPLRDISTLLQAALDENNSPLDQSLGTDQFVVGGIVGNIQDTDLSRADLGTPGEVSRIQSEGAVLEVSSSSKRALWMRATHRYGCWRRSDLIRTCASCGTAHGVLQSRASCVFLNVNFRDPMQKYHVSGYWYTHKKKTKKLTFNEIVKRIVDKVVDKRSKNEYLVLCGLLSLSSHSPAKDRQTVPTSKK